MASRPPRTQERIERLKLALDERGLLYPLYDICRRHFVLPDDVLAGKRTCAVTRARDACVSAFLRLPMSSSEVGELFDMDHSSIICARNRHTTRNPPAHEPAKPQQENVSGDQHLRDRGGVRGGH